jgi:prevent-host-death family protein
VAVAKHGRPVIVVMAVEEFDRLKALDALATALARVKKAKE